MGIYTKEEVLKEGFDESKVFPIEIEKKLFVNRENRVYSQISKKGFLGIPKKSLFSGIAYNLYNSGELMNYCIIKNGIRTSESANFYKNGGIYSYRDENSSHFFFYPNGRIKSAIVGDYLGNTNYSYALDWDMSGVLIYSDEDFVDYDDKITLKLAGSYIRYNNKLMPIANGFPLAISYRNKSVEIYSYIPREGFVPHQIEEVSGTVKLGAIRLFSKEFVFENSGKAIDDISVEVFHTVLHNGFWCQCTLSPNVVKTGKVFITYFADKENIDLERKGFEKIQELPVLDRMEGLESLNFTYGKIIGIDEIESINETIASTSGYNEKIVSKDKSIDFLSV